MSRLRKGCCALTADRGQHCDRGCGSVDIINNLIIIKNMFFCCFFVLIVGIQYLSGLFLAVLSPGKRHSAGRVVLIFVLTAVLYSLVWCALLIRRYGTGTVPFDLLFNNLRTGSMLYQDVGYFAQMSLFTAAASCLIGLCLCRLVNEGQLHLSRLQENMVIISFVLAFLCLYLGYRYADHTLRQLKLTGLHGDGSLAEANGIYSTTDYIKLMNTGENTVDLDGLFLSDELSGRFLIPLSGNMIAAGEELVFYLDDLAPFKLSAGETVYLTDTNGTVYDQVSYEPEGDVVLGEPVFSAESGFYDKPFLLSLDVSENTGKNGAVYYTLDGSEPTPMSQRYTEPIEVYDKKGTPAPCRQAKRVVYDYAEYEPENTEVDRAFIVRAAVFDEEGHRSRVANGVYFIGTPEYTNRKVISITADYDSLFGLNGICTTGPLYDAWYLSGGGPDQPEVNFWKSGRAWEIKGNLQYFNKGEPEGGQDVGLRVFGGSSRDFALKHFSIYSRKSYSGSDSFCVDFFDNNRPVHSIALRDGTADAVLQDLCAGRKVAAQPHAQVSVFLNGEFWFDTYACEKYSPAYFYEHKGIAENNIIIVKEGLIDQGEAGDELLYDQIYEYIADHDLSDQQSYEEFCDIIDVQSYIDYICATAYGANLDQDEIINRQLYRARKPVDDDENDGRWRWCLYDMDFLGGIMESPEDYGVEHSYEINPFSDRLGDESVNINEQTLFRALIQNDEFKKDLVATMKDMMETDFSMDNVKKVFDRYEGSKQELKEFFKNRPEYMNRILLEEFGDS